MFRLSMAFIPGMIVATLTGIPVVAWLAAFFTAVVTGFVLLYFRIRNFRMPVIAIQSFFVGGLLMISSQSHTSGLLPNATYEIPYTGIVQKVTPTTSGHRATLQLLAKHTWMRSHKILVYFSHCGQEISIGDSIAFSKKVDNIPPPLDDFEFNASRYYASLGIHHRVFLQSGDFSHRAFHGFSILRSSDGLRRSMSRIINKRIANRASASIVVAMLIGDKSNLDSKLRTSYSKAGAIHILAISGLHIGIVASILIGVFGRPNPQGSRTIAILKTTAILFGIWAFTWISGMSPSATRAAFMFTVYLLGLVIMRKAQILNILGFTAICLLLHEPFLLYNLGFQLSFLALSGIVIWGIPLLRLFTFRYRIFQYGWSIIAISLGAQIFVAPAILYYFNEISIISPISSLVAIPAAYVIVFGGILILIADMIAPVISSAIGEILSYGIDLINQLFTGFSAMPLSTLNHIYLHEWEVTIFACLLLLGSMRLLTGQKQWLWLMVPVSISFAVFHSHLYFQRTQLPLLTIYVDKSALSMDVISRANTQTSLDIKRTNKYTRSAARQNRLQHYSNNIRGISYLPDKPGLSNFQVKISTADAASYDIIYLGSDPGQLSFPPERLTYIILSKGIDYRVCRQLKNEINQPNLVVHDMRSQGAFKLILS